MAKTKLYYKDGIAYYKAGGRFHALSSNVLPKAQTSMDLSNLPMPTITGTQIPVNPVAIQTGPMPPPPKGPGVGDWMKGNPSAVAGIGTAASSLLSNFGNQNKNNAQDPTVGKIMKGYNDSGLSGTLSTGLDAASSLDPTGTTAIVNAALKVGKGVGNLVKNENEYGVSQSGAQEVIGNVFDPLGHVQQSLNIGKKHGFGEGLKNFATFGYTGNKLMEEDQKRGEDRVDYKSMAERQGLNKGNYRNDSVYAKRGVNLQSQPLSNKKKPNVEIEDGEILLGNPGSTTKYGNVTNSLTSKFATKFHGDKHGEDTDKDGMEGIPLNSDSGYIASNFLGMDGRKVNKQNGGKTVADEMTPLIDYLHQTEQNSQDAYRNNPVAIKEVLRQLEGMKNTAEVNKFRVELEKMIKNQEIPLEEVFAFIQQNAPTDDMSPEQLQGLEGMMPQPEQGGMAQGPGGPQQQMQGDPQDIMAMIAQQAGAAQQQGGMPPMPQQAKNGLNMYNRYNRFQQGGPMPGQEQEQNPSSNRMEQLMQQSQQVPPSATNPAMQDMEPEVQQMFAQLPPEIQEQIMSQQLSPQEMEVAIMTAFESIQGGQGQQMPPMGPGMEEQGGEQMDPAMMEQAMMAEQQALMQLGGYTNEYFGDQFRDKNKVDYTPSQDPRAANAHLPRPVQLEGHFNPQTKTHMKQMGAFQDNYQTGGAIDSRMVEMVQQLVQQGYSPEQAIQVAQQKLAQEAPEKKMGGMIGKTVKFKAGGQWVSGKIKSYNDKTGEFRV